jgi:formamidopyrimidine-DNA glycosylase
MPELPEVETIVRRLKNGTVDHPPVPGQIIKAVDVTWNKSIAEPDPLTFVKKLIGKQIVAAKRRAKYLHFPLNEGHMMAHLRMSGDMRMEKQFLEPGQPRPIEAYDRVIINFESPWRLVFSNIRKFGRMWYVESPECVFKNLGPEPLESHFTPQMLYEMLQAHHRQLKPLLMDQHFIAGMGNVYTDEALFLSKLHPLRISDSLTQIEAEALLYAIQSTLREGIKRFGASIDWIYRGGEFQNHFNVYGRQDEPCPNCGQMIKKITVGQRGTHFCPNCQKALAHHPEN